MRHFDHKVFEGEITRIEYDAEGIITAIESVGFSGNRHIITRIEIGKPVIPMDSIGMNLHPAWISPPEPQRPPLTISYRY